MADIVKEDAPENLSLRAAATSSPIKEQNGVSGTEPAPTSQPSQEEKQTPDVLPQPSEESKTTSDVPPQPSQEETPTPDAQPQIQPDLDKISAQIKFYFSDYNLRRDKFLRTESAKEEGWIPIVTLATFNRIKQLGGTCENIAQVVAKDMNGLVDLSEDRLKIRRSSALPPFKTFDELSTEESDELNKRTLHIKGFSREEPPTLDELSTWCAQYGEVEGVEMRRLFNSKKFKGCIFVVYRNQTDAEKVLAVELLKYNEDCALLKEDRAVYLARKKEFYEKRRESQKAPKSETGEEKSEGKPEEGKRPPKRHWQKGNDRSKPWKGRGGKQGRFAPRRENTVKDLTAED